MAQVAPRLATDEGSGAASSLTGVGLIGLFNNLILTGGAIGGLGVASAATREIAAERSRGEKGEFLARRALVSATLILSIVATALTWLFRRPIAQLALGDPTYAAAVGWLSIAVGLTVIASSQTALLAGLRRMGRMAQTYVAGGVIATIAAIASLFLFHSGAIVFFVIALPLANVLAGAWFVARLPRPASTRFELGRLWRQWRQFMTLGLAIMLGQLLANGAQLAARGLIIQRLGLPELGLFQAAWTISGTYLGVVLQAMAADYYPRLSEAIHEPDAAVQIVNEQTEVALLLGAPIILAALGLAPLGLAIFLIYFPRSRRAPAMADARRRSQNRELAHGLRSARGQSRTHVPAA